jgi:hypothetical protein
MPPPYLGEDGYVKQIMFVGIFMIIEGVLEVLFGCLMAFYAAIFPIMMASDPQFKEAMGEAPPGPAGLRPEQLFFWFALAMGVGPLIAGVTRTLGGVFAIQRRNRKFVIAANIVGFLSLTSCYCIPTGIATSIYSIIILLQQSVANAFAAKATANGKLF